MLHAKPNSFEWADYKEHTHKRYRDHIMANPYQCDECGDTYNKADLYKLNRGDLIKNNTRILFKSARICKNCLCSG